MKELLEFPIVIGMPYRIVVDKEMFFELINKYNKLKNLYFRLEKTVFFDFDKENWLEDIKKLHKYLKEMNTKHFMLFSGGGGHIHILLDEKSNKETLKNIHLYYIKKLQLEMDFHVLGDSERLCRIPNSYNIKRKKYCIPISSEDLIRGLQFIREKAHKQNFHINYYGTELLKISDFYKQEVDIRNEEINLSYEVEVKIKKDDFLSKLPKCISASLLDGNSGWKQRAMIILYLRDSGYLVTEVIQILKQFLTAEKFNHCIHEEKQVQYLFKREDLFAPNCCGVRKEGFCVNDCDKKLESIYL